MKPVRAEKETKVWYTTKYAKESGVVEALLCEMSESGHSVINRSSNGMLTAYQVGKDAFKTPEEALERVAVLLERSIKNLEKKLEKLKKVVPTVKDVE